MTPSLRPAGVLISVKDLDRSTTFYVDVLGLEVETSDADVVVLGGGEWHFLTLRRASAELSRGVPTRWA